MIRKPQFIVDWQKRQAEKAALKLAQKIRSLGGFTAADLAEAIAQARLEGVVEGVAENQILADNYLAQVVGAVQIVFLNSQLKCTTFVI